MLPTMSSVPELAAGGSVCRVGTARRRVASAAPPTITNDATRADTSGHMPRDVCERITYATPKPNPASSASGMPERIGSGCPATSSCEDVDMSPTAPIASTMPIATTHDGRSPMNCPNATGTIAATTAVIGATTLMRATARPRYKDANAAPLIKPMSAPSSTSRAVGAWGRSSGPATRAVRQPNALAVSTTVSTDDRFVANPPKKSAEPYATAASSAMRTPTRLELTAALVQPEPVSVGVGDGTGATCRKLVDVADLHAVGSKPGLFGDDVGDFKRRRSLRAGRNADRLDVADAERRVSDVELRPVIAK